LTKNYPIRRKKNESRGEKVRFKSPPDINGGQQLMPEICNLRNNLRATLFRIEIKKK
jgi:hypothetical protein